MNEAIGFYNDTSLKWFADRYSTEIHCIDFTFLTTKKESENNLSKTPVTQKPTTNQITKSEPIGEEEDDLPF